MVEERAKKIKLLILDVDGVMTDGRITFTDYGDELKFFHVHDGLGLVLLHRAGIPSVIITASRSRTVLRRAKELGIAKVFQNSTNKLKTYEMVLRKFKVTHEEVCFIGDDLIDLPILSRCGLAVCVANGSDEIKPLAHYVTKTPGGQGAIREVTDLILKTQGKWSPLTQPYFA